MFSKQIKTIESLCNNLSKARTFQVNLAKRALLAGGSDTIRFVAGIDISYTSKQAFASAVVMDLHKREIIKEYNAHANINCKYIPTFLFLRELPTLLRVFEKIDVRVDCFLIDGHGLAHPFYAGIALMFGVITGTCAIGVAKKPLRGFKIITVNNGKYGQIFVRRRLVGFALKKEPLASTIYISPGNNITLLNSLRIVEKTLERDKKLPLPLYYAHIFAERFKRKNV